MTNELAQGLLPLLDPHRVCTAPGCRSTRPRSSDRSKLGRRRRRRGRRRRSAFSTRSCATRRPSGDRDHLRLLVEQNPKIPDRTEHLVGDGMDPTLALPSLQKLQAGGADLIAIPCSTAHAFIQSDSVRARHSHHEHAHRHGEAHSGDVSKAAQGRGLLATSGTVSSGRLPAGRWRGS